MEDEKFALQLMRRIYRLRDSIAAAQKEVDQLRQQLVELMTDRGVASLQVGHYIAVLRDIELQQVDTIALREHAPDVARLYTVQRQSQRLHVMYKA